MQSPDFQHILRICNTNVDGKHKVMFALTAIKVCLIFAIFANRVFLRVLDEDSPILSARSATST